MKKLFISIYIMLLFCSCEQEYYILPSGTAASFVPVMESGTGVSPTPVTRVIDNLWTGTETVGVAAFDAADPETQVTTKFHKYVPNSGMSDTRVQLVPDTDEQPIYYPVNGDIVTFTAFAPYPSASDITAGYATFSEGTKRVTYFLAKQSTATNVMEKIDFIHHRGATTYSQSAPIATLGFEHKLSRVIINLTRSTGYAGSISGSSVVINNVYTSVACNIVTGAVTGSTAGIYNITPARVQPEGADADATQVFQGIVAPQTATSSLKATNRKLTFTVAGETYETSIPQNFEAGKSYTYNFEFGATGVTLAGSTVMNWGAGNVVWGEGYYLTLSESNVVLFREASGSKTLTIKTDHKDGQTTTGVKTYRSNNASTVTDSNVSWLTVGSPESTETAGEYTLTYNATANTGASREAYIHVKVGAVLTAVVKVVQNNIAEPVTVLDGESNCFIVAPGTKISFPVTRPVTAGTVLAGASYTTEIVWDDTEGRAVHNFTPSGKIGTDNIIVTAGPNPGNAVLAVKNTSGEIIWSYHIWVTDYNPYNGATYTNEYSYAGTKYKFTFMDRNLGATFAGLGSGLGTGLFYQWGRKDPFPATLAAGAEQAGGGKFTTLLTSASVGTVANAIKNPGMFITAIAEPFDWHFTSRNNSLWGYDSKTKTIYDPCPNGWRVPINDGMSSNTSPWYGFTLNNGGTFNEGYIWGTNAAYPATGIRHDSGGPSREVKETGNIWCASPVTSLSNLGAGFYFNSSSVSVNANHSGRARGYSVRCVKDEPYAIPESPVNFLDGESNCFVIAPGKTIYFPVTRPVTAGTATNGDSFTTEIVWDDTATKAVAHATPSGNIGEVIAVTAGPNPGNAVLAIKNASGVIVWSYHIWVSNYNPDTGATYTNAYTYGTKNYKFTFMDRNLGATFAGTGSGLGTGLFYQWGRKDPFPATLAPNAAQAGGGKFTVEPTSATVGTVSNAIKNPGTFITTSAEPYDWHFASRNNDLWGHTSNKKTIYDPCPKGWRVPINSEMSAETSPWKGFTIANSGTWNNGWVWNQNANAAFPAPGCRGKSGGTLGEVDATGHNLSASPSPVDINGISTLYFYKNNIIVHNTNTRATAFPVRCVKDQPYAIDIPLTLVDGEANNFIVTPGTAISIPVTRPVTAGTATSGTSYTTEIIWDDTATKTVQCLTSSGKIGTNNITVTTGSTPGNAVLAVKVNNVIVWSYHIWVTDDPTKTTYTNNGYTFMDRNLGATSATPGDVGALGMQYQWGRKDPFPSSNSISVNEERTLYGSGSTLPTNFTINNYVTEYDQNGVSMAATIKEPWKFYWFNDIDENVVDWCSDPNLDDRWGNISNKKTLYDPCPAGWRVPVRASFTGFDEKVNELYTFAYTSRGRESSTLGWWPTSGFRRGDNGAGSLDTGVLGYYWSTAMSSTNRAFYMGFNAGYIGPAIVTRYASIGMSVRCVKDN